MNLINWLLNSKMYTNTYFEFSYIYIFDTAVTGKWLKGEI